jgi:HPt (histidine-containing phosphotransfer) domain-containing protein
MADEKTLATNHEETMKTLEANKAKADKLYKEHHQKNTNAESQLRKEYKKAANAYKENMIQYDSEMKNGTKDKENTQDEYEQTLADLN